MNYSPKNLPKLELDVIKSINIFDNRGEAALRINCDTLDTFRSKECKEIIETAKINNIQLKYKISVNFPIIKTYRLFQKIK